MAASLILVLTACDKSMDTCDPLGPAPIEITLGEIVAAGADDEGHTYVVDRVGPESRVFVEKNGALVHYPVSAEGGGGTDGVELLTLLVAEVGRSFLLQIETSAAGIRMAVLHDPGATESFEIGTMGVELTVLAPESVADMPVSNVAAGIELEYVAALEDGRLLVVSRPSEEWSYEDFRAFFGSLEDLTERPVTDVARLTDGGSTTIELEIDGATATASFPIVIVETDFVPGPATLTIAKETHALARLPHAVPEGAVFHCLDPS